MTVDGVAAAGERAMRVEADRGRCYGAGNCVRTAPTVFDQDDDEGLVMVLDPTPPEAMTAAVVRAAALCPVGAITVVPAEPAA